MKTTIENIRKRMVRENQIYIMPSAMGSVFFLCIVVLVLTAATYNNSIAIGALTTGNAGANTAVVKIDATAPTLTVPQSPVIVNATAPTGTDVATYPVSSNG